LGLVIWFSFSNPDSSRLYAGRQGFSTQIGV
jgi:hypothetical protein